MSDEHEQAARRARAEARTAKITGELVTPGGPKPSPYVNSTPEERIAAAVRLIEHHQALRGAPLAKLPRSEWPGETFFCG